MIDPKNAAAIVKSSNEKRQQVPSFQNIQPTNIQWQNFLSGNFEKQTAFTLTYDVEKVKQLVANQKV